MEMPVVVTSADATPSRSRTVFLYSSSVNRRSGLVPGTVLVSASPPFIVSVGVMGPGLPGSWLLVLPPPAPPPPGFDPLAPWSMLPVQARPARAHATRPSSLWGRCILKPSRRLRAPDVTPGAEQPL